MSDATLPPKDDSFVDQLLNRSESFTFECKRIGKVDRLLESVVALANSNGGIIALGLEDPDKATGRDRVYGIQCHPLHWDELQRKLRSRITEPDQLAVTHKEVGCTLRDGTQGSIVLLRVQRSGRVHSIVDDGTFIRLSKGNKQLTAGEITDLCHARGVVSAETRLEEVDFELLDTDYWRAYARQRKLTRPTDQAMFHVGLARRNEQGQLRPTRAAVLLFAEDPSGVMAAKAAIRIFHYHGTDVATDPNTNLVRKPVTIGGPLIRQITDAKVAVLNELAEKVQFGPFGFEIVQRYPVRLRNQNQPSAWQQVSHYLDEHGSISNAEVRDILGTEDRIRASRQLKNWVDLGILVVANPDSAKKLRRYRKPDVDFDLDLFAMLAGK